MKRLDPASADLRILQDSDLSILPAEVAGRAVPQVLAVPTATTRAGAVRPEVRPRTVQAQGRGHTAPAIKRRVRMPRPQFVSGASPASHHSPRSVRFSRFCVIPSASPSQRARPICGAESARRARALSVLRDKLTAKTAPAWLRHKGIFAGRANTGAAVVASCSRISLRIAASIQMGS